MVYQKNHIGLRIKLFRIKAGMRISDVEKKSGICRNTISLIERGERRIAVRDFAALCVVLGVSANELICGSEQWNPEEVSI